VKREDINKQFIWRLADIYATDAAWEADFAQLQKGVSDFASREGTLGTALGLLATLRESSRLDLLCERLFVYARMKRDEDAAVDRYVGLADRAGQLATRLSAATSFMEPEILSVPREELLAWAALPEFADFRFGLSNLDRQRAYCLSKGEERLLAMAQEPLGGADNIFSMLNDADLTFGTVLDENGEEVELTHGSYGRLLVCPDRRVRREAYESLYAAYHKVKNSVTAMYDAAVKRDVFSAHARGFAGALEQALYGGNVPVAVYEQLIEAVRQRLPALQKYLDLRKRVLGLDALHPYDLYTPMLPALDLPYDYEQAKALVKEALAPLGEEYGRLLDEAYQNGWIDVYENEGKRSGAYSWGAYGTHPYVLLNYQGKLEDVFTLAHELGHAMHSYFSDANQPFETAGYKIMVAEVASTVNESLLLSHLLDKETDKDRRAYLLNRFLEEFRTTCFRQTLFAEFELATHRMAESGQPLTLESLKSLYRELNETYYPGVVIDENIVIEWMRIPHFYRAFYVYQYATGLCAAVAIARSIREDNGKGRYLHFLTTGGSDYPIELLKGVGVDLTAKDSILAALDVFAACVDELDALL